MTLYVKELVEMYEKRAKEKGKYKLPGEAPFCGRMLKCRSIGRAECVNCEEFKSFIKKD